jgi:hypothetical protein
MKELLENWSNFVSEEVAGGAESVLLRLPKFRISEKWGTPGSDDRKIIEMFTSKIAGATLGEKIESLNSFVSECDAGCAAQKDVSEILASLVFLDSLSSVIYDFNDRTGGFLFESLISALFGGKSKQITTSGGKDQDVTDIIDDRGRNLSLKFFFSGASQYVGGSYNNLVASIEQAQAPMYYVVAVKNRKSKEDNNVLSIDFYEFSVGIEGIEEKYDFDAVEIGKKGKGAAGTKAFQDRGPKIYNTKGNGLHIKEATNQKFHIGNLNLGGSRSEMQALAQRYSERLGSVLLEIYEQIDLLSKNVNEYYVAAPEDKDAALRAAKNATALKEDADELAKSAGLPPGV